MNRPSTLEELDRAIRKSVQDHFERIVKEEQAEMLKRVQERLPKEVASVAVELGKYIDYSSGGNFITLRVRLEDGTK